MDESKQKPEIFQNVPKILFDGFEPESEFTLFCLWLTLSMISPCKPAQETPGQSSRLFSLAICSADGKMALTEVKLRLRQLAARLWGMTLLDTQFLFLWAKIICLLYFEFFQVRFGTSGQLINQKIIEMFFFVNLEGHCVPDIYPGNSHFVSPRSDLQIFGSVSFNPPWSSRCVCFCHVGTKIKMHPFKMAFNVYKCDWLVIIYKYSLFQSWQM